MSKQKAEKKVVVTIEGKKDKKTKSSEPTKTKEPKSKSKSDDETGDKTHRKERKLKPTTRAKSQIRKQQSSSYYCFPFAPFQRIAKWEANKSDNKATDGDIRIARDAVELLRHGTETFMGNIYWGAEFTKSLVTLPPRLSLKATDLYVPMQCNPEIKEKFGQYLDKKVEEHKNGMREKEKKKLVDKTTKTKERLTERISETEEKQKKARQQKVAEKRKAVEKTTKKSKYAAVQSEDEQAQPADDSE